MKNAKHIQRVWTHILCTTLYVVPMCCPSFPTRGGSNINTRVIFAMGLYTAPTWELQSMRLSQVILILLIKKFHTDEMWDALSKKSA